MPRKNFFIPCAIWILVFCSTASCDLISPRPSEKVSRASTSGILQADKEFSKRSLEVGMRKAYLEYMSNDAVLLRPGTLPVVGADAIDYLSQVNDDEYQLSWVPDGATISDSGDLGFTFGTYQLVTGNVVYTGTYVNIWKKQNDGTWKFILNAGNQGTSENN